MPSASTNEDSVRKFFKALEESTPEDVEAMVDLCTPDVVFYLSGAAEPPLVGHEALRAGLKKFLPAWQNFRAEMLNVASNGSVVFAEREESMLYLGKHQIRILVVTVAEVGEDGKFTTWKDYFDPTALRKLTSE